MKKPMTLYRVQRINDEGGMWYNADGTSNRLVDKLTNKRLAELPMGYDPRYHENGERWQCAAWDINHLKHWFNDGDMAELIEMGFIVTKFTSTNYVIEENQVLFTMSSVFDLKDITEEFKLLSV